MKTTRVSQILAVAAALLSQALPINAADNNAAQAAGPSKGLVLNAAWNLGFEDSATTDDLLKLLSPHATA